MQAAFKNIDRRLVFAFIIILLSVVIVHSVLYWPIFLNAALYGDENVQFQLGAYVAEGELWRLNTDHFMPGNGLLTAPFLMLSTDFDANEPSGLRVWFTLIHSVALAAIGTWAFKGRRAETFVYILFLLSSALLAQHITGIFNDLLAGVYTVMGALLFIDTLHSNKWSFIRIAACGFICGIVLYWRPNLVLVGPLLFLYGVFFITTAPRKEHYNNVIQKLSSISKVGSLLIIGFATSWGPWVTMKTIKEDQLILHPALYRPMERLRIWALSPPGAEWGMERKQDSLNKLLARVKLIYSKEYPTFGLPPRKWSII